jgi:hypothetical protein
MEMSFSKNYAIRKSITAEEEPQIQHLARHNLILLHTNLKMFQQNHPHRHKVERPELQKGLRGNGDEFSLVFPFRL